MSLPSKNPKKKKRRLKQNEKINCDFIGTYDSSFTCCLWRRWRRTGKDSYRNKEITREEKYIGRKCDVIENFTLAGTSTTHLDQETGIILKSEAILKSGDTESRVVQALVTELEYGKVTKDDVTVDLSDYELTVEEPKEEKEEAKAE